MITFDDIRAVVHAKDWEGLRALHTRAQTEKIEKVTWLTESGVRLAIIEAALFRGDEDFTARLLSMLDAIDRGNLPWKDNKHRALEAKQAMQARVQIAQWKAEGW